MFLPDMAIFSSEYMQEVVALVLSRCTSLIMLNPSAQLCEYFVSCSDGFICYKTTV